MRDPVVALYVGCALLLAWGLRVWWPARHTGGLIPVAVQAATVALAALALPLFTWYVPAKGPRWTFVAVTVAAMAAGRFLPRARVKALHAAWRQRPRLALAALALWWTLMATGGLEIAASSAVRARLVQRYAPTETVLAQQTEDWRLAHVMSDDYREPEPELLWQPVARPPYTSQRFRGPEISAAPPPGTLRVLCFGDSNTDGPLEGGAWPEALGSLLTEDETRQVEVLNAGVTGYSSYQGARRAARDVPAFRPGVVLVSFGWNDAANAIGGDDRTFAAAARLDELSPWRVAVRRALFRYDAVLVAARLMTRGRTVPAAAGAALEPRVALDDYARNLEAMVQTAAAAGARTAILTRPHRESEAALSAAPGWRHRVPAYNARARAVAAAARVPLIDAQRHFDGRPEAFADESHLTRQGHAELAALVVETLQREGLAP